MNPGDGTGVIDAYRFHGPAWAELRGDRLTEGAC